MTNYYEQIKELVIDTETTIKVKDYTKNRVMLENYYEIGRLIVEAQGGETRAKYGDGLIKEYSRKLSLEVDKRYGERTLRSIRKFYMIFKEEIWKPVVSKLNWSHILMIMRLDDINEMMYYANRCITSSLSKRELERLIRSNEYERLPDDVKEKLKNKQELTLKETITDPIFIPNPNNKNIIKEKELQKLIMENIFLLLKRLGPNYHFVGNEYPIRIGNRIYKIDLLLFNMEYNSYVVIELKIGEFKKEYISQIETYMNYVDKNIKRVEHNKTIGIILCQRNNKLLMEYCSKEDIIIREYVLK